MIDLNQAFDSDVVPCQSPTPLGPPACLCGCPLALVPHCHASSLLLIARSAPAESPHMTQHDFPTLVPT